VFAGFDLEDECRRSGCRMVAGVDEAGRGALFGPVVAAAVILPLDALRGRDAPPWAGRIRDSKLLTPNARRRLFAEIRKAALAVGVGLASREEIDRINIYWASLLAMRRAAEGLPLPPDMLLVDGFAIKDVKYPQRAVPQGDRKSVSIAAASIVAKVVRDGMMAFLNEVYGGYGLAGNKGYGTAAHYRALRERGPTPFHRSSFNLKLASEAR
jgi:ribonuclease HII